MEEIKVVVYRYKETGKIASVYDYTDRKETLQDLQKMITEWNAKTENDRTTEMLEASPNVMDAVRFLLKTHKQVHEFDESDEVKAMRDKLQEIENLADDISSLCRRSF